MTDLPSIPPYLVDNRDTRLLKTSAVSFCASSRTSWTFPKLSAGALAHLGVDALFAQEQPLVSLEQAQSGPRDHDKHDLL